MGPIVIKQTPIITMRITVKTLRIITKIIVIDRNAAQTHDLTTEQIDETVEIDHREDTTHRIGQ